MIPFNYADTDLNVFKSYRATTGEAIISIGFRPEQIGCGGGPGDEPAWTQWFYISPDKELTHIGNRMRLFDVGDYDRNGVSEVVFWTDQYNCDGYFLFFDRLSKNAVSVWSYH